MLQVSSLKKRNLDNFLGWKLTRDTQRKWEPAVSCRRFSQLATWVVFSIRNKNKIPTLLETILGPPPLLADKGSISRCNCLRRGVSISRTRSNPLSMLPNILRADLLPPARSGVSVHRFSSFTVRPLFSEKKDEDVNKKMWTSMKYWKLDGKQWQEGERKKKK